MTWDGKEKRAMNSEYEHLKGQIALLNEKIDNLTKNGLVSDNGINDLLKKHNETLYGNGKAGLTTIVSQTHAELSSHILWDRWLYGLMVSLLLAILSKLINII